MRLEGRGTEVNSMVTWRSGRTQCRVIGRDDLRVVRISGIVSMPTLYSAGHSAVPQILTALSSAISN